MYMRNLSDSARRELNQATAERYGLQATQWADKGIAVYAYTHARIAAHKAYLVLGRGQGRKRQLIAALD